MRRKVESQVSISALSPCPPPACLVKYSNIFFQHRFSQHYPSYPSLSEHSSESESLKRRDRPRLLPDIKNMTDIAGKAKSFEGLTALLNKTSLKDIKEHNKSKISFNEAIVPRRQKLKISQAATNKLGGLSVSKAQILRRHTLHDKSNTGRPQHVHSWHKQVSTWL